jgi:hypothetical protein
MNEHCLILQSGHGCQHFSRDWPVLNPFIATNLSVPKLNAAPGELSYIGFMRNQNNGKSVVVELLKYLHDLN